MFDFGTKVLESIPGTKIFTENCGPVDQNIQKQNSSDRITCINGGIYS